RRRNLPHGAIELLWHEMGLRIREEDAAERIVDKIQRLPSCQIRRTINRVNARRSGDAKSKRANWLLSREGELNRHRIGEYLHALILQVGDGRGQIRGGECFGENESRERIAAEKYRAQVRHVRRQR